VDFSCWGMASANGERAAAALVLIINVSELVVGTHFLERRDWTATSIRRAKDFTTYVITARGGSLKPVLNVDA
jgi:hypothetical protein